MGYAIKSINPTRVIVVFDGKDGSARRRSMYPDYKSKRKVKIRLNRSVSVDAEDNQLKQLIRLTEYLEFMPITVTITDGVEADDVIAYLANDYLLNKDSQVYVMSSDKDFMQLVDDRVHVWSPTKKKMFYTEDVVETYGCLPNNFALYRSLIGDEGDNIPGISGVGHKTIVSKFPKMATEHMTIESFLEYVRELQKGNKAKIYQKVLDAESELRLYYAVIQLAESNINLSSKMRIMDTIEKSTPKLAKIKFHSMLIEDSMTTAIRNVEVWLKEITTKLDNFTLQND